MKYFCKVAWSIKIIFCYLIAWLMLSKCTGKGLSRKIFKTWPFFKPNNNPSLSEGPPTTLMYLWEFKKNRDCVTHSKIFRYTYLIKDSIIHSLSLTPLKDKHCKRFSWQSIKWFVHTTNKLHSNFSFILSLTLYLISELSPEKSS